MKLIECPRDAMQGLEGFIPTSKKIAYINQLLKVGFDTIDFGSFVSHKAIPQLRDTVEVLKKLDLSSTKSKLLAIVANERGADDALAHEEIAYLGFPLSISETFQKRNTNKSIAEAMNLVDVVQNKCVQKNRALVVYLSMAFGNPYNDPYEVGIVEKFSGQLATLGVQIVSLADTIGISKPDQISYLFKTLTHRFPHIDFGAHLHSDRSTAVEKINAAFVSGCHRFDGAIKGFGGCPMAEDKLIGNLDTQTILNFLADANALHGLNENEFAKAALMADEIFPTS